MANDNVATHRMEAAAPRGLAVGEPRGGHPVNTAHHVAHADRADEARPLVEQRAGEAASDAWRAQGLAASPGARAYDLKDHIIRNKANGVLLYDSNEIAAGAVTQLATLTNKPTNVDASDGLVI